MALLQVTVTGARSGPSSNGSPSWPARSMSSLNALPVADVVQSYPTPVTQGAISAVDQRKAKSWRAKVWPIRCFDSSHVHPRLFQSSILSMAMLRYVSAALSISLIPSAPPASSTSSRNTSTPVPWPSSCRRLNMSRQSEVP